jgi:hypothetical protein
MPSARHAESQRRLIWPPSPGYFRLALVRGGWRVPCRIISGEAGWHAEINGEIFPPHPDPVQARRVDAVWHGGIMINESDFLWLESVRAWALAHEPEHPAARPLKAIDPRRLIPIMPAQHQQRTSAP